MRTTGVNCLELFALGVGHYTEDDVPIPCHER